MCVCGFKEIPQAPFTMTSSEGHFLDISFAIFVCIFVLDHIRALNSNARCKEANQPIAGHQVHPGIEVFLLHQQFNERKKEVSLLLALKEQ